MFLATLAAIIAFSTGISAISCYSGSNVCVSKEYADLDTCASCLLPNGVQMLHACTISTVEVTLSCFAQQVACKQSSGVYTTCQTSDCNRCDKPLPNSWLQNTNISFPSFIAPLFRNKAIVLLPRTLKEVGIDFFSGVHTGRSAVSLCLAKPSWTLFLPSTVPFPFNNDPSVMSVLIWQNSAVFSFLSTDCSGESRQPYYMLPQTVNQSETCFVERSSNNTRARSVSLSEAHWVVTIFSLMFQQFPLVFSSYSSQDCSTPPTVNPEEALRIIDLLTDYFMPLLSLVISCRSLLFRPQGSRLILPQFSRLWVSHSPRQDRCAAWFLTSTFNNFVTKLCLAVLVQSNNIRSLVSFWFGLFPTVFSLCPLMACSLFVDDRIISTVSCIYGCLMAAAAFIRVKNLPDWMADMYLNALGIISVIPPLMFASTSAIIAFHPAQFKLNQHDHPVMNIAIRVCNSVFGCSRKTLFWHHARTAELISAIIRGQKTADSSLSRESLISAPNPMSARMMTLLFMSFFWSIYLFCLFALNGLSMIDYFHTFAESKYRSIPIAVFRGLVVIFVLVMIYHLFQSVTEYRARYIRMSTLCRLGLVPYGIQASTSFHLAVKFMATEAIQAVAGKFIPYVLILMTTIIILFFFILMQFLSQNFGISLWKQLIFLLPYVSPITLSEQLLPLLTIGPFLQQLTALIVFCKVLGSTWLSPIRLFRVENSLLELPMRYANCFCLRIRYAYIHIYCTITLTKLQDFSQICGIEASARSSFLGRVYDCFLLVSLYTCQVDDNSISRYSC